MFFSFRSSLSFLPRSPALQPPATASKPSDILVGLRSVSSWPASCALVSLCWLYLSHLHSATRPFFLNLKILSNPSLAPFMNSMPTKILTGEKAYSEPGAPCMTARTNCAGHEVLDNGHPVPYPLSISPLPSIPLQWRRLCQPVSGIKAYIDR